MGPGRHDVAGLPFFRAADQLNEVVAITSVVDAIAGIEVDPKPVNASTHALVIPEVAQFTRLTRA